jgi:thiol peroxidase
MTGTIAARILIENASYPTFGELPRIGSYAPEFTLVNTKLQDVSLVSWSGKRKILYVGISVDDETCARSVIRFDEYVAGRDDVVLLVVSCDLPFAHKRFRAAHDLQAAECLSAIRHAGFGENYGVEIMEGPMGGMFSPAVLVLDENNTIVHREHLEDISVEPGYAAAFRALGIAINE